MPLQAAPRLIGAIALDAWLRDPAGVVSRPGYFWKSALAAEPGRSKPVSVSD